MKKIISIFAVAILPLVLQGSSAPKKTDLWEEISDKTTVTVYNAVSAQCDKDCLVTASNYRIDKEKISKIRIAAMERTMMKRNGLTYGSIIMISGAGSYDGLWQIEDTMNKRFTGQDKVDLLVPDNVKTGLWNNVKIYVKKKK